MTKATTKKKLQFSYPDLREKMHLAEKTLTEVEKQPGIQSKLKKHLHVLFEHIMKSQDWTDIASELEAIMDKNQAEGTKEGTKILLFKDDGSRHITATNRDRIKEEIKGLNLDTRHVEFYPHWFTDEERIKKIDMYLIEKLKGFLWEETVGNKVLLEIAAELEK